MALVLLALLQYLNGDGKMPTPRVIVRTGDKVIMVGDSITQVVIFYQALASSIAGAFIGGQAPAPAFQNAGLNGARVGDFNDPTVRANNLAPHVNDVGIMVIFLGINDRYQSPPTPLPQFRANYSALLNYVTTTFTGLRSIILMTPWLIGAAPRGAGPHDTDLDQVAAIVADLARAYGLVLLDVRERWFTDPNPSPNPLTDDVHPNGIGTLWLSEQLRSVLEVRY